MTGTALPAGIGDWGKLPFWRDTWPDLARRIAASSGTILPPGPDRLNALRLTHPEKTRVVILGQDPYPTPGHAHGLAFSVTSETRPLPRSLGNIFKELEADTGLRPENGDLQHWADQGVLLLNTALTVPAGAAGGHIGWGWEILARQMLRLLDADRPRAFLLWGARAQGIAAECLHRHDHLRIETAHPSPLSARRGFFGSRPFSRVNSWLADRGEAPVRWA